MDNVAIATVKAVVGKAYARNADGELRELRPGDTVMEGETVVTPDGGSVELSMSDGSPLVISDMPEMTLTADLVAQTASTREESEVTDETINDVLAALESGEDLGDVLAATAAGGAGGGAGGAGSSFIRLGRIVEGVDEFHGVLPEWGYGDPGQELDPLQPVDALDDVESTNGEPVVIRAQDNDIFLEGERIASFTQPENGSVVLNSDGTFTYTPREGFDGTDTFTYVGINPTGTAQDEATVTIVVTLPQAPEPQPLPLISIGDAVVQEGDTAIVTISLSAPSDQVITVKVDTFDRTATSISGDYDPDSETVTFNPGETEVTISIPTNVDDIQEGTEFLVADLSDPVNAEIHDGEGVIEIVDDFTPTISIGDDTVVEGGTATVTVSLSAPVDEEVTVSFNTADGSATVGNDYNAATGTITFAPGQTSTTVSVTTVGDTVVENNETFFVNLSDADGATIVDGQGEVIILDDDVPPPPPVINNPPDAVNDGFSTEVNTPVSGNVLPNDSDPDNDPLTVTGNTQPTNGSVTVNPDGSFTYTPNEDFDGSDSFEYTITDGEGGSDTATVNLTVTDQPIDLLPTVRGIQSEFPEAQLPGGSAENPGALSKDGVFTVTAGDGLDTLVINDVEVIAGGEVTDNNIVTDTGVQITIKSVTEGADGVYEIAYTATLISRFQHDADSDEKLVSFTIEVTDTDGDSASAVRSATIIDDSPSAQSDANAIPAEEFGPVGGNVISNDTLGADTSVVVGVAAGDTGASLDDPDSLGTIAGLYGDLTLSSDGTYTYTRNPESPGDVEDVFTYTLKDADGDLSATTLTISIGDAPVTLDLPVQGEDGTIVAEDGLAGDREGDLGAGSESAGSEAATDSETTAGTFFYTAPDGPAVITIGDVAVATVGQTFAGSSGTLTITSIDSGVIGYSYTLADNTSGDASTESFEVVVTDDDGDFQSGDLVIDINDDVATARADTDSLVDNDTSVTGNVITGASEAGTGAADTQGADGAVISGFTSVNNAQAGAGVVGGAALVGEFGTLTLTAAGTYVYTQTAGAEATGTDVFEYTLTDGDGDTSTATLTINLDGGVTIDAPDAEEAGTIVSEAGLDGDRTGDVDPESAGSAAAGASETTTGSITFSGNDTPLSVTIDGVVVTGVVGQEFQGDEGVLTIVALNAGSVDYSYTLSDNTSGDATSDSFAVAVTDDDGDTANDTLFIDIVDDVPTARADTDSLVDDDTAVTGNVVTGVSEAGTGAADTQGADGASVTAFTSVNNAQAGAGVVGGAALVGEFGELLLASDGTYTYTQTAGAEATGSDVFNYTLTDGDGDPSSATLTINLDGGVTVTVPGADDDGTTVLEAGLPEGTGELSDDIAGNDNSETTSGTITFTASDTPVTISVGGQTIVLDGAAQGDLTVDGAFGELTLDVSDIANGNIDYSYTLGDNIDHDDVVADSDTFAVIVTDEDGDSANGSLVIAITDDGPEAVADTESVIEGESVTGDVLTNDIAGADNETTTVIGVRAADPDGDGPSPADTTTEVTTGVATKIFGQFGSITLGANGGYTYEANANTVPPGAQDVFVYSIEDSDGTRSTTTLTITHSESGLQLDVGDGNIESDDATLGDSDTQATQLEDSNGAAIAASTYVLKDADPDGTITLQQDGDDIGVVSINSSTGVVTFVQSAAFSHALTSDLKANALTVTVIGTETSTGNTAEGDVVIDITDDKPTASIVLSPPGVAEITEGSDTDSITFSLDISGTLPGADVPAVETTALVLGGIDGDNEKATALQTTSGNAIYLKQVDSETIVAFEQGGASRNPATDTEVFRLALDVAGDSVEVTVGTTGILHNKVTNDTAVTLDGLDIKVVHAIVDADGDEDTAEADIGSQIQINDTVSDITAAEDISLIVKYDTDGNLDPLNSTLVDKGQLTVDSGVDGPDTFSITAGSNIDGLTKVPLSDGSLVYRDSNGNDVLLVSIDSTGEYCVEFLNPDASVVSTVDLTAPLSGSSAVGSFDFAGSNGELITVTPTSGTGIQSSSAGLGGDANSIQTGDSFLFDFNGEIYDSAFTLQLKNQGQSDDITVVFRSGNDTKSVSVNTSSESVVFNPAGFSYDSVEVIFDDRNGDMKFIGFGVEKLAIPDALELAFTAEVEDADGDTDAIDFDVDISYAAPIAVDLDGDGVEYLSRDAGVVFTDEESGESVNTAWVAPDDGLLVIDADDSGTVNASEEYVFTEWSETAETDMEAVAEVFDTNQDGVLDANDEKFDQFAVWQDADSDGVTDEGELTSLADLGVDSIALTYSDDSEAGTAAGGDVLIHGQSTVTYADGSTSIAEDTSFAQESLDLRDLLAGDDAADDLSAYLNVSFDGESTIVEVSKSGSFQGNDGDATLVDQTITLEGVDLVGGMDDVNSVIQSMLDSGKLTIDS
ncbi:MAG: retention module-containing protein [Halioglobus sp.]